MKNRKQEEFPQCKDEQNLRLFIDYAPFAMAMFDKEMHYIALSKRWISDYNLQNKNVIGKSHYEIFPDLPQHWKEAHKKGMEGISTEEQKEFFARADGSKKWLHWEVRPWYGDDNEVGGIIIFSEDITNRMLTEEKYNSLFDKTGTSVAIIEVNGTFSLVNENFASLAGASAKDLVGTHFLDFVDDEDKEMVVEYHQKRINKVDVPDRYEIHFITKNGQKGVGLVNSVFLQESAQTLVSIIDITDRKTAENELIEREKELNIILDNIPMMIFVKDAKDLRYVRFNKTGEQLTGIPRENLFGKNDYDFFPKEEADFFTSRDRDVLSSKTILDIPEEPIHAHDGLRFLHTKKVAVLDEKQNPKYLLGISEDISEKKQTQEALQKEYERTNLILKSTLDGYILSDKNGIFLM